MMMLTLSVNSSLPAAAAADSLLNFAQPAPSSQLYIISSHHATVAATVAATDAVVASEYNLSVSE